MLLVWGLQREYRLDKLVVIPALAFDLYSGNH